MRLSKNILNVNMVRTLTMVSRYIIAILCVAFCGEALAQRTDYPIQTVPFTKVKLTDKFWLPRIETNHKVTIPASFERCEETGR